MSKELTITVDAPAHHGSVGTAVLLKVLLGNALPDAVIELEDTVNDGPATAELLAAREDSVRELIASGDTTAELNEFFVDKDFKIRIVAKNHSAEA